MMRLFSRKPVAMPDTASKKTGVNVKQSDVGLEEILDRLVAFGRPHLMCLSNGWFCSIELSSQGEGWNIKVSSEFRHALPLDAAYECLDRLLEKVKS